jgi:hypothetical protein
MGQATMHRVARTASLAAALVGMTMMAAAAQAGPFDVIRGLPSPIPIPGAHKPAATPASAAGDTGAMMMKAPTPQPPLHGLGTDAVAVVEAATPGSPVQVMDYVFAKQTIQLQPRGKITLSYLSGCLSETYTGGAITMGLKAGTVAGGVRTQALRSGCRAPTPVVLASASEAGATVNRITPFTGANWSERALRGQPVFKWDRALGAAVTVRIHDMDKAGEPVVWEAAAPQGWIAYPATAPKLATGMPYKAEAVANGQVAATAFFSIDPALDVSDSVASRLVPLAPPA